MCIYIYTHAYIHILIYIYIRIMYICARIYGCGTSRFARRQMPVSQAKARKRANCHLEPKALSLHPVANPKKLETGLRTNRAGVPSASLLRIEAVGFPTFLLLL